MKDTCEGCKFWDSFSWACCNGYSPYRADFVNKGCDFKEWEEEKMQIKVKLDENAIMPTKAHDTDAGFDLYSPEKFTVEKCSIDSEYGDCSIGNATIDTGVHIEIPRGYVGMIKSKSGLNVKHDLTAEGVIDSGYTGSIVVKLYNHGSLDYDFRNGDKIAQLVILPIPEVELIETDTLEETERGNGGFGSSGR